MRVCEKCGAQVKDTAPFCACCGAKLEQDAGTETKASDNLSGQGSQSNQQYQQNQGFSGGNGGQANYQTYTMPMDPYDHTGEFDLKDISDNKVIAMVVYLLGTVGIIIALLAANNSPYAGFHVRQMLKFTVLEILAFLVGLILFWTVLVPIAAGIFVLVLAICKIIAFFSICKGKAKEPYIVRNFNFLK